MTIRDKIRPFTITDYGSGAMLTLYSVEDYKQELFDTRVDEGFTGSAEDWQRLAQLFISENMPELLEDIQFEADADILTIYADDTIRLESLAIQFKNALDNDDYIYPLFKQLTPCPPSAPKRTAEFMIKIAAPEDVFKAAQLALEIYKNESPEALALKLKDIISDNESVLFILESDNIAVGIAHCSLRHDSVKGAYSGNVGYVESIYVTPDFRRKGYGRALLEKCREWTESMGCTEFAADCLISDDESLLFYLKTGFSEVCRTVSFAKKL